MAVLLLSSLKFGPISDCEIFSPCPVTKHLRVLLKFYQRHLPNKSWRGLWLSSLWIVSIPCHLVIIVLQNFIFLVMELVNVIYLKKICDRIGLIQSKRTTSAHGSRKRVRREGLAEATDYLVRTISSSRESSPAPSSSCVPGDAHGDPLARKPALYGIGKSLMDRVYSLLFFIIYRLQLANLINAPCSRKASPWSVHCAYAMADRPEGDLGTPRICAGDKP
ncbi:unnamed protein product [Schistocephalus solidus]|uniref:Uncharacterized protein n=1 Tax=Schistocephalus solidus TaxID=70667 RepID=A0A183TS74_SCHSO|nr:unnamed protein product [Schistocephalus solidus]